MYISSKKEFFICENSNKLALRCFLIFSVSLLFFYFLEPLVRRQNKMKTVVFMKSYEIKMVETTQSTHAMYTTALNF